MREILVGPGDLPSVMDEGTVVLITGTDARTGEQVTFAGDHGPMQLLLDGLLACNVDEQLTVLPEEHQILRAIHG